MPFSCQIQNLRKTRDLRLPRLLSGQVELDIPERVLVVRGGKGASGTAARQSLAKALLPVRCNKLQTLRRTRDLLLPRLLSGQVKVDEVEEVIP